MPTVSTSATTTVMTATSGRKPDGSFMMRLTTNQAAAPPATLLRALLRPLLRPAVRPARAQATYDAAAREFVIHTPHNEASKAWIGGSGQS